MGHGHAQVNHTSSFIKPHHRDGDATDAKAYGGHGQAHPPPHHPSSVFKPQDKDGVYGDGREQRTACESSSGIYSIALPPAQQTLRATMPLLDSYATPACESSSGIYSSGSALPSAQQALQQALRTEILRWQWRSLSEGRQTHHRQTTRAVFSEGPPTSSTSQDTSAHTHSIRQHVSAPAVLSEGPPTHITSTSRHALCT